MALPQSRMKLGFYPLDVQHYEPVLALLKPTKSGEPRILDPFAGEGDFIKAASEIWNMQPYANEIEKGRYQKAAAKLGVANTVLGDFYHLSTSTNGFQVLWLNPPYDTDSTVEGAETPAAKRMEYQMMREAWRWGQDGAIIFWVIYKHHLTNHAAKYLSEHSRTVDVYSLPGKHLGQYDQIIVVAQKGDNDKPRAQKVFESILTQRDNPIILDGSLEDVYDIPSPKPIKQFIFTSLVLSPTALVGLEQAAGAWQNNGYQELFKAPVEMGKMRPVVSPRPGHIAFLLAAGLGDGAYIETEEYGAVAIRGVVRHVEDVARVEEIPDDTDPGRTVVKTHMRRRPKTTITLLSSEGETITLDDDEAMLRFITDNRDALVAYINKTFEPIYQFDFAGVKPFLNSIRLGGEHKLYGPQKHVIAACIAGFREINHIMLVGQMGTGKTVMGGVAAMAIAAGVAEGFAGQYDPHQAIVVVAPPHLIYKWERELRSVSPRGSLIEHVNRIGDIHWFMDQIKLAPTNVPKVMIIKRDMVKLGCSWEPAVQWKNIRVARWPMGYPTPEGYEDEERIKTYRAPLCPCCGAQVVITRNGEVQTATLQYLKESRRTCAVCLEPLWQESRPVYSKRKKKTAEEKKESLFDIAGLEAAEDNEDDGAIIPEEDVLVEIDTFVSGEPTKMFISKGKLNGAMKPGTAWFKTPTKPSRYRLDEYLQENYPDRVFMLVWDEVHEAQHGDTGNGEAFGRMVKLSQKVLCLTGTPFNGRASSMFNLEYNLNPDTKNIYIRGSSPRAEKKDRKSKNAGHPSSNIRSREYDGYSLSSAERNFVGDMGVLERVVEEKPTYRHGAYTGTKKVAREYTEGPGISPLLVSSAVGHTIYFSLKDLGKALPTYEEIAMPVPLDDDIAMEYADHHAYLKDYLIKSIFDGNPGFAGAYLQWSMSWHNAVWRDYTVIHNVKNPHNPRQRIPYTVLDIPAHDPLRIYNKERELAKLVATELAQGRPVGIFCRQTDTKDIQPRIKEVLERLVPEANVFILSNKTKPEKRESIIQKQVNNGVNVFISNPELVKTGLDLIYFPTLVFYEIVYNLSTMMQAAGRSYRLNQTHPSCKVVYMYSPDTMEETALALMSRKQRAAKMLTGDIGLSGLDALTEQEGSFEQDLLKAITDSNDSLVDPSQLFKSSGAGESDIENDDKGYWQDSEEEDPHAYTMPIEMVLPAEIIDEAANKELIQEFRDGGSKVNLIVPHEWRLDDEFWADDEEEWEVNREVPLHQVSLFPDMFQLPNVR